MAEEKTEIKAKEERKICPGCDINYIFPDRDEELCPLCKYRESNKKENGVRVAY